MQRTTPPLIKIYEALWAIADERIEIDQQKNEDNLVCAKIYSSSRKKHYDVTYSEQKNAIMANDNWSYWKGYLWYPALALLFLKWKLALDVEYAESLKDIKRKDINTKNKNDFDKTMIEIDMGLQKNGINIVAFKEYFSRILDEIQNLNLEILGEKLLPPEGY